MLNHGLLDLLEHHDPDLIHRSLVWNKGHIALGFDRNKWRHDDFGNLMR